MSWEKINLASAKVDNFSLHSISLQWISLDTILSENDNMMLGIACNLILHKKFLIWMNLEFADIKKYESLSIRIDSVLLWIS